MKNYLIEKLGGFHDKKSFLDSLTEIDRNEILNEAVTKLFNTIGEDDIFKKNEDGQYTFEGRPQTKEQVEVLKTEAKYFFESKLYRVLDKEVKYQANIRLRYQSKTDMDIVSAKLIEWTWDCIKSKLNRL